MSFCRDCLADGAEKAARCPACGSPRLARHPELDTLTIAHIDCDAFYATIEKRDDPSLRDKPVIIGGGRRGVVATACYIARTFGVKSAMPMFEARRLCPHATVVPPDMAKYVRVGREVRALMLDLTPLVEPLSIDEAFLDLAGTERLHGHSPARSLAGFARAVEEEIGITVSIGLSENKFLAKLASDLDKPRGFSVLGQREAAAFLAPKPVTFIWGVGKQMGAALAHEGFRTIADLQRATETDLMRRFGTEGLRLARLARSLAAPTQLAAKIFAAGRDLLEREAQGTRFRLIGIGVSALGSPADADPADLVDPQGARSKAAEHAVDRLRAKFGRDAVVKGLALDED